MRFLFLFLLLSAFVSPAHAASLQNVGAEHPGVAAMWNVICQTLPFCGLNALTAPGYFAGKVIAIVQSLITVVAIIMILYASILLNLTSVDEGKKDEAKTIVIYALAGIALALVGGTLMQYLLLVVYPQLFNG